MSNTDFVYPFGGQFDKDALLRGMNSFHVVEKLVASGCAVHDLLIAGQVGREEPITEDATEHLAVLRLLLVYRHQQSNTLGTVWNDVSYRLLRDLEAVGKVPN